MRSGGSSNKLSTSFVDISCPSDPTLVTPYVELSVALVAIRTLDCSMTIAGEVQGKVISLVWGFMVWTFTVVPQNGNADETHTTTSIFT